jgi:hypothetical protein
MWICHRNPLKMSEMRKTVDGVTELQEQLQELYEEVNRMIEEGDEDTARALIEANYESLMEQFEPGVYCVEQAAMLDVLAQLRMSLGDFVEVEDLLIQVCNHSSSIVMEPVAVIECILSHLNPEHWLKSGLQFCGIEVKVNGRNFCSLNMI